MVYLLDANVLIRAHEDYYPIDRVPQFWSWVAEMAMAGLVKMPLEIHGEIAISTGPLKDWICGASVKSALVLDEEVDPELLDRVLNDGYAPDLTDRDIEKIGQDPFLIAYGLVSPERIVVTKEVSKPSQQRSKRKIPDVCASLGIRWMRDFELYRLLNFSTAGR